MKIVYKDDLKMVIKDSNIFGIFIGGIFLLIGLIILLKLNLFYFDKNIPWWVGTLLSLLGLSSILLPTFNSIVFDKSRNILEMRQRNLFWNKNQQYDIKNIKQLELWEKPSSNSRGLSRILMCVFKEGNSISLSSNKLSSNMTVSGLYFNWTKIPEINIGQKVASFLNVPFIKELRPLSVSETMSSIKEAFKEEIEKSETQF